MTTPTRLERNLPGILDDLSAGPTFEYLDDVFARTARMRQRPAWTFPERWFPMADITRPRAFAFAPPLRTIAVALVVIALLAAAAAVYVGSHQQRVPAPFGPARNGLIPYESSGDIYVGDPVTGASRLLVGGADDDHDPGFSPDGTFIAFMRSPSSLDLDLYTVRPDGTDLKRVTTVPIPSDSWVNWTPDSKHLAVIHKVNGQGQLDILDMSGQRRRLAGDIDVTALEFRPPLAQEILFRGVKDGHLGLFAMNTEGTNIRALITSPRASNEDLEYGGATYSADGTRIFYQSWTPAGYQPEGCCQLWVMDADGSNPHQFVNDAVNAWEGQAAVSPDGQWVAFWRVVDTTRVAVVRADGSGPVTQIGPNLTETASWTWAPDSSKILMVPSAADSPDQYLLDPAGGPWTLTKWTATSNPDWQRLAP
jgi:Tol biopolymer transport system component